MQIYTLNLNPKQSYSQGQFFTLANLDLDQAYIKLNMNKTDIDNLTVGSTLVNTLNSQEILKVVAHSQISTKLDKFFPQVQTLCDLTSANYQISISKKAHSLAIIILSDKGYADQREDKCAEIIQNIILQTMPLSHMQSFILPDNPKQLQALTLNLAITQGYDLIISSGGTGLSPRDLTPEALSPILDRRLYGFEQAMMQMALSKTATAVLSRAICGTLQNSLIISLPGSPKAVQENLQAISPALDHALKKLQGDNSDCAK